MFPRLRRRPGRAAISLCAHSDRDSDRVQQLSLTLHEVASRRGCAPPRLGETNYLMCASEVQHFIVSLPDDPDCQAPPE